MPSPLICSRRVRSVWSGAFFLAFLLHCSQVCLTAAHIYATMSLSIPPADGSAHAPCHSSPVPPTGVPDHCPDCGEHVFLSSIPESKALTGLGSVLFSVWLPTLHLLAASLPRPLCAPRLEGTALCPKRYLRFSVLRL